MWIYNRSEVPVFVHSYTLERGGGEHGEADADGAADIAVLVNKPYSALVIKLQPGHCLLAYDAFRYVFRIAVQ